MAVAGEPPDEPSSPRLPKNVLRRHQPMLKPDLDEYLALNFVKDNKAKRRRVDEGALPIDECQESRAGGETPDFREEPGTSNDRGGGGNGSDIQNSVDIEKDEQIWRVSVSRGTSGQTRTTTGRKGETSIENTTYPRTLGSSVSVLDDKDAVARSCGARFVGEDPMRGRLRAADPFQWMSRLHAGATAMSSLVENAENTLRGLAGGSMNGSTSTNSDSESDRSVRSDRTSRVEGSRKDGEESSTDGAVMGRGTPKNAGGLHADGIYESIGVDMNGHDWRMGLNDAVITEDDEDENTTNSGKVNLFQKKRGLVCDFLRHLE